MRYLRMRKLCRVRFMRSFSLRKSSTTGLQYKVNVCTRICYINIYFKRKKKGRGAYCIFLIFSVTFAQRIWSLQVVGIVRDLPFQVRTWLFSIHLLDIKNNQFLVNAPLIKRSIQQQASHPVFFLYPLLIPCSSNSLLGGQHQTVTV